MDLTKLRDICRYVKIDINYQYNQEALYESKLYFLMKNCNNILDIGRGSNKWFKIFKKEQITTLDINKFNDYPDVIDDICDIKKVKLNSFDAIICNAVLEHVYAPELAVKNIHSILKKGGYFLGFMPFLWRYHAPKDLNFQDFFRFTKDGIAYLFRDFSQVTLFPSRGKYSSMLNLHQAWKKRIEKRFREKINFLIDRLFRSKDNFEQVSGYIVWAVK